MRNTLRKAMPASMRRADMEENSGRTSQSDSTLAANSDQIVMADLSPSDAAQEKQERPQAPRRKTRADGKRELTEDDAPEILGFAFPTWKKWWIITVIFVVQTSMNFNASIYGNSVSGMTKEFHISEQAARVGQAVFLVAYAFGCELWAPWSEEYGRWIVLQLSLGLVNLWQLPVALAPNFGAVVVGRFLGGISSAGGSVTLGMVADMWEPDEQQYAVAYVVFSSVGGSVVGPIVGAFVQRYLDWRWVFWLQLIFGGATQILHFFTVPETRATIMLDQEAKKRKKADPNSKWVGPHDGGHNLSYKEVVAIWIRPFKMFATEPIVLSLSLLSGFSDALIFTFIEGFTPVYEQWGFGTIALGLAFIPILIGYVIAWISFLPVFYHDNKQRKRFGSDIYAPERRLWWLLFTAPLEFMGLFIFAWTSQGPRYNHWMGPMFASAMIGVANYAIYMATIDYMIAAYGPYAASATGGNGFARDFLAGIAAMYSTPFYENLPQFGRYQLEYPSTILAVLAFLVTIPIFVFYYKGAWFRERSKFAQTLDSDRGARKAKNQKPVRVEYEESVEQRV